MIDPDALLPAIQAGDAEAFARWVGHAEDRLRASLTRFARSVDTEAVLQEALLRVWQVAPRVQVDGKGDSLLRFAIRVARNLAVDHARAQRLTPTDAPALQRLIDDDAPPAPTPPDPLLRRLIALCRERLPQKPSLALTLRVEQGAGRPDRDLAALAGMTLNTFLQNFGRARRLLIDCLAGQGVDVEAELP